jgi:hypothetical protein
MHADPDFLDDYVARRRALLDAWVAWDEHPGDNHRVKAMEDACRRYAGLPGATTLRRYITNVRRHGGTPEEALDAWESDW